MGSIINVYDVKNWYVDKEFGDRVSVVIGEMDDYTTEDLKITLLKKIYEKIKSGEYSFDIIKRRFIVYDKNKNIIPSF